MCLIIHKPNKDTKLNDDYIDNAEVKNPDGFGIVFTDTGERVITMDYDEARQLVNQPRPFVAHWRYATRGEINITNCHPFKLRNGGYLFSNGTVAALGEETDTSDTLECVKILNQISPKHWSKVLSMTDTRFAIVNPDLSVVRHGKWHKKDDIYYSKDNCFSNWQCGYYNWNTTSSSSSSSSSTTSYYKGYKNYKQKSYIADDYPLDNDYDEWGYPEEKVVTTDLTTDFEWHDVDYVAVYGTLKMGHGNCHLLESSKLVNTGKTTNKYPMQVYGVPYVYHIPNTGLQIDVEVYKIDSISVKNSLDMLEVHPTHYTRKLTSIELDDGSNITAWLYFAAKNTNYNKNMKIQASY